MGGGGQYAFGERLIVSGRGQNGPDKLGWEAAIYVFDQRKDWLETLKSLIESLVRSTVECE